MLAGGVAACSGPGPGAADTTTGPSDPGTGEPTAVVGVAYTATDLVTGTPVDLDGLPDGPVLLSTWATWCEPCRTELPALERLHQATAAAGLTIVTVNVDAPGLATGVAEELLDELGVTMLRWRDDQNLFRRTFHSIGVPTNVLLDAHGQVVQAWMGAIDPEEPEVVAALEAVLEVPPA